MARRYARDNRGRFAPKGAGATARGGRLKTASGNKRATQTMQASGAKPSGAIKGKVKRDPGAAGKIGQTKAAAAPRAASPRRKAVGKISEAKAGRIISRIDANRPGLRKATGSARKTANSIKTQRKATDFALAAGARARKQGKSISVNESLQRGVKNAAAKNASRAAARPAKPAPKVDTSLKGVAARRARALAPRTSTYLSQKLNTQSAITRSAANAIYNRQRAVGKQLGLNQSVVRNPIGIMSKTSGSTRNRAEQLREAARKRVVGGRRR